MRKQTFKRNLAAVVFAAVMVFGAAASAMAFGHYTPGSLGVNAATLPPPGFHYTAYNVFYNSDSLVDGSGNELPVGMDLNVFAMANQFTYITDYKILGADFGFDMIIPLVYTNIEIKAAGVDEDTFGIGDLYFEPIVLAWHTKRWDVALCFGFYAPTAESDTPSSPGAGYWSFMETLGATFYFDEARTWTFSVLTRWLQNTEDRDTDITPGADMVAEYGIAKAIPLNKDWIFTGGIAGYTYAQLTDDDGTGADDEHFLGNAVGPEVRIMTFQPIPIQVSLRYLFEYGCENTTEGQNVCLTLIGSF